MDFYKTFQSTVETILVDIVFPLASTSPAEMLLLTENPDDFVAIQEDCCDKQVSYIFFYYKFSNFLVLVAASRPEILSSQLRLNFLNRL